MPTKPLSEALRRETLDALEKYGSVTEAAKALDVNRSTFSHRVYTAKNPTTSQSEIRTPEKITMPEFVGMEDTLPAEELLDHMERISEKKRKYEKAQEWFSIKISDDSVRGLAVGGDPHLGPGCNISLLRQDVKILAETEGMMAVNIGDTADNWGRLIHLYAEQDISRKSEQILARWFLSESNIPWLLWLFGNHDQMHSEFSTYLKTISAKQIPMVDWRARFKLKFPSCEIKVDAAHNHKGTSIYNPLHGQKRAALWDEDADVYVAGHHHNWSLNQEELQDGRVVWMGRARGYKYIDDYAKIHGFRNHEYGATILFVIDPKADKPTTRIQAFADLEEGAEYLKWKRSRS